MKKWKFRVQHCGLHCGDDELLTNVHYADDWMLYEGGDIDLASMVESLLFFFLRAFLTAERSVATTVLLVSPQACRHERC